MDMDSINGSMEVHMLEILRMGSSTEKGNGRNPKKRIPTTTKEITNLIKRTVTVSSSGSREIPTKEPIQKTREMVSEK